MVEVDQKKRLENRISTCESGISLAKKRLKDDAFDLKFWTQQLEYARNELNYVGSEIHDGYREVKCEI